MIRRKLTRLEVTLDDTKELDELFSSSKVQQFNNLLATGSLTATTSLNKLLGKTQASTNITAITPTRPDFMNEEGEEANSTTNNTEPLETSDQLAYNPQPHNSSSRFQINTDSQQLR